MFQQHPNGSQEKLFYKCAYCIIEFKGEECYENHIQAKHQTEGFICELCGLNFITNTSLIQHCTKIHKNEKTLLCLHCPKKCSNRSNLERHILLHTQNKKNYICELCASSYFSQSALKEHFDYSHKEIKEYNCKVCNKSFGLKRILLRHEAIHSEERKFKCNLCPHSYKTKSHLTRHNQTHKSKITEVKRKLLKRFIKNENGQLVSDEDIAIEYRNVKKQSKSVNDHANQNDINSVLEINETYSVNNEHYDNCGNTAILAINKDLHQYSKNSLQSFQDGHYILPDPIQLNEHSFASQHNTENTNNENYKSFPLMEFYSEDGVNIPYTNIQILNTPNIHLNYSDMWQSEAGPTSNNNIYPNSHHESYIHIGNKLANLGMNENHPSLKYNLFNLNQDNFEMNKPNKSMMENINNCQQSSNVDDYIHNREYQEAIYSSYQNI